MTAYVVDENVPIVANDTVRNPPAAPQADVTCRLRCVQALRSVVKGGIAIIDEAGELLAIYRRRFSGSGQPGVGDMFFKHLSDHQYSRRKVCQVYLGKDGNGNFESFPSDAALATFDRSDRIFVALACAAPKKPTILNAVDSDYSQHIGALTRAGVHVREICPNCIRT